MEDLLLAAQFLHYLAALLLAGTAVLRLSLFSGAPGGNRLAAVLLAVAIATGGLWLLALAALYSGSAPNWPAPADLWLVLTATDFGRLWLWRSGIAMLLALTLINWGAGWRRVAPFCVGIFALAFLLSLALTGHAIRDSGWLRPVHIVSQATHLLGGALWLGGLILLLSRLRHTEIAKATATVRLLRRFSGLGYLAVALILVSGLVNIALIARGLPSAGAYSYSLAIKLVLVAAMLSLAATNRFALVPNLADAPATILRRLRLSVACELVIGLIVVAVAAWLASLAPPG